MWKYTGIGVAVLLAAVAAGLGAQAPPVRGMATLTVSPDGRPLAVLDADAVVVPIFENEDPLAAVEGAGPGTAAAVRTARDQGALTVKPMGAVNIFAPDGLATKRLVLLGAGSRDDLDPERLRRLAGTAMRSVRGQQVASLAFVVRGSLPGTTAAAAAVEGALIGAFDAGLHKTGGTDSALTTLHIAGVGDDAGVRDAVSEAQVRGHATNFARSLALEPANYMSPEVIAQHARALAQAGGLEIEVLDERQMAEMGMGGILAVGKGSANPPRLIALIYRPAVPSEITLALVGKGVAFDSGGISLKGNNGMYRMKGDMAGGAAVLGAMRIVASERPDVAVIGVVPAVENLPSGTAQKPGDVWVGLSGKTVEVMSTDAEGRMILSDGITYALRQGATHVVDVATLTGSVRTALGDRHIGAFASDDGFFARLEAASRRTGESVWRLPIDEEYASGIRSSLVADLTETGGRAGASVGAKFIQQFTEGRPWIHLDIAGTSWPDSSVPYRDGGPTGVTVRTMAELARWLGTTPSEP